MLQEIIKGFKNPPQGMITVNFILCDNNLLLTKQTSERVKKDLEGEVEINGESYLEFSSAKKRTEYQAAACHRQPGDLAFRHDCDSFRA